MEKSKLWLKVSIDQTILSSGIYLLISYLTVTRFYPYKRNHIDK
ncbi:hypothetical protein [Bacillus haynesii]|nr:hypothetical protein [Bacillus haynesii]